MNTHSQFAKLIAQIESFEPEKDRNTAFSLLKSPKQYSFSPIEYTELLTKCVHRDIQTIISLKNIHTEDYPAVEDEDLNFFASFHTKIVEIGQFFVFNSFFSPNIEKNTLHFIRDIPFSYSFSENKLLISNEEYTLKNLKKHFELLLKSAQILLIENCHIIKILQDHSDFIKKDELLEFINNPEKHTAFIISKMNDFFINQHNIYQNSPNEEIWDNTAYCEIINTNYFPENLSHENVFLNWNVESLKRELKFFYLRSSFIYKVSFLPDYLISVSGDNDSIKAEMYFSADEHQLPEFLYKKPITLTIDDNGIKATVDNQSLSFLFEQYALDDMCDLLCDFCKREIASCYKNPDNYYINQYKEATLNSLKSINNINIEHLDEIHLSIKPKNDLWSNSVDIEIKVYSMGDTIFEHSQLFSENYYHWRELSKNIHVLNSALEQSFISKNIELSEENNSSNHSLKKRI